MSLTGTLDIEIPFGFPEQQYLAGCSIDNALGANFSAYIDEPDLNGNKFLVYDTPINQEKEWLCMQPMRLNAGWKGTMTWTLTNIVAEPNSVEIVPGVWLPTERMNSPVPATTKFLNGRYVNIDHKTDNPAKIGLMDVETNTSEEYCIAFSIQNAKGGLFFLELDELDASGACVGIRGLEIQSNNFTACCSLLGAPEWKATATWSLINVDNPSEVSITPLSRVDLICSPANVRKAPTVTLFRLSALQENVLNVWGSQELETSHGGNLLLEFRVIGAEGATFYAVCESLEESLPVVSVITAQMIDSEEEYLCGNVTVPEAWKGKVTWVVVGAEDCSMVSVTADLAEELRSNCGNLNYKENVLSDVTKETH